MDRQEDSTRPIDPLQQVGHVIGTSMKSKLVMDLARYTSNPFSIRSFLSTALRHPGYAAGVFLRVQEILVNKKHLRFAAFVRHLALVIYGADFLPGCVVGSGLMLPHPNGVVIGKGAVIGQNSTILQGVTIGEKHVDERSNGLYPDIGDNVIIGSGAKLLGPIKIFENVIIGANSVVVEDCPANAVVVGIPGKKT